MADGARGTLRFDVCIELVGRWLRSVVALQLFLCVHRLRIPAWAWILLIWFLFVVPAIALRGYHFEEGSVIALARGALEDGQWLVPSHYGYRLIERPILYSWLVAVLGEIFGINHWTARMPTVVSLLAAGGLVFWLVRQRSSVLAALFGAFCFFVSPGILQKVITAEPDLMLSVLLFAAFVLWWSWQDEAHVTVGRWIAIGALLSAAALVKGPQPIAYFTIGVGAYLVLYHRWSDIPGFLLANSIAGMVLVGWYAAVYQPGDLNIWVVQSRMAIAPTYFAPLDWPRGVADFMLRGALEWLPALLLLIPSLITVLRVGFKKSDSLTVALLLYALCTTVILAVWPGARTRYAMPGILAAAAIAGLQFESFALKRPAVLNATLIVAFCLATYQIVLGWLVMPVVSDVFQKSAIAGRTIRTAIEAQPATLYAIRGDVEHGEHSDLNNNVLAYVPSRVRDIHIEDLASVPTPGWVMVPEEKVAQVRALRPDLKITLRAILHEDRVSNLIELRERCRSPL